MSNNISSCYYIDKLELPIIIILSFSINIYMFKRIICLAISALILTACHKESLEVGEDITPPSKPKFVQQYNNYFIYLNAIQQPICGNYAGTSAVIGPDLWMTAAHVVAHSENCKIFDEPLKPVYVDEKLDYAVMSGPTYTINRMRINCDGMKPMKTYYSVGFAKGRDYVVSKVIATSIIGDDISAETRKKDFVHVREVMGSVWPGMSGGPVIDDDGAIVGINISASRDATSADIREMKDTYLCKKDLQPKSD